MRLRLLVGALCATASVGMFPAVARAADCRGLPKHTAIPVVDVANVLPPDGEAWLAADLMYHHITGHEAIVAATVPDLGGDDVASYAKRLFDCWGVGDKGSDNGVLILVAMREHRVRIELGAALGDRIPDEQLSLAVETMVAPLRAGDVVGALRAAAGAVAGDLGTPLQDTRALGASPPGDPTDVPNDVQGPIAVGPGDGFDPYGGSPGGGFGSAAAIVPVLVFLGFVVTVVRAIVRGGSGGYGTRGGWRGGFPGGMTGVGYWGRPAMFRGGSWSDPGTHFGGGSSDAGSMGTSSSGGSSFGGGSSGGGGASGSW